MFLVTLTTTLSSRWYYHGSSGRRRRSRLQHRKGKRVVTVVAERQLHGSPRVACPPSCGAVEAEVGSTGTPGHLQLREQKPRRRSPFGRRRLVERLLSSPTSRQEACATIVASTATATSACGGAVGCDFIAVKSSLQESIAKSGYQAAHAVDIAQVRADADDCSGGGGGHVSRV